MIQNIFTAFKLKMITLKEVESRLLKLHNSEIVVKDVINRTGK